MSGPSNNQDYHPCQDKLAFTIPQVIHNAYENIPETVMSMIIQAKPDGEIMLVDVENLSYVGWKKKTVVPNFLKGIDWKDKMNRVRDQGGHDTCWAVVASELISALRFIRGDDPVYTEYSSQFLVDYACPEKRDTIERKGSHYCYKHSILSALRFVQTKGIPLESHWTYKGCREAPPPTYQPPPADNPHVYIASAKSLRTIDMALQQLRFQPIGAALSIFTPDYYIIKDGIYRGPMYRESEYKGLHAVSIYGVREENGETIALVKSTHSEKLGDNGYFKVSLDVMMIEVPREGKDKHDDYRKPRHLLSYFCYPELLPR